MEQIVTKSNLFISILRLSEENNIVIFMEYLLAAFRFYITLPLTSSY